MSANSIIEKVEKIKSAALEKFGAGLVGAVLYGSFVKGKEYKDVDVLIVLEELTESRIERIKDIVEIKRVLVFPADILLISKEECINNFKSHNPLFLDIASEGKVICDKGLLEKLINETKLEIQKNKIKKEFSRWIFPVKDRIPTTLSGITNKDWANYWLEDSKRDLQAAESLHRDKLFERAVYHCQQSVEKSLKSVLMCFGVYEKTHYVASILKKEIEKRNIKEYAEKLDEIIKIAEELEPHVSLSRYPGISGSEVWLPSREYTKEISEKAIKDAKKVFKIGKEFVKLWFKNE